MLGNELKQKKVGSEDHFETILQRIASLETKVNNICSSISNVNTRLGKIDKILFEKITELDIRLTKIETAGKLTKVVVIVSALGISAILGFMKLIEVIK